MKQALNHRVITIYCDYPTNLFTNDDIPKAKNVLITTYCDFILRICALSAAGAEGGGAETVDGHHYEADEGEHK